MRYSAAGSTAQGMRRLLDHGRRILPALVAEEVTAVYAGLRPATEQSDYRIELHAAQRYLCLGGIRSTGLTAAMGLAERALELLRRAGLTTEPRPADELAAVRVPSLGEAGERPWRAGGHIVCHCERVTADEIDAACAQLVPPLDLDGVRRRTRALLGRCQGFACTAAVVTLAATGLGVTPHELRRVPE